MRKRGEHFARKKGDSHRNARPGNKNGAKGPRVGRQERATTAPATATDRPHRQRRKRAKTGGRDFVRGTNSHTGETFRRGKDNLPRGNATLMLRVAFHDFRERIYRSLGKLVDTPRGALAFMQEFADRTEGRPVKKIEPDGRHYGAVFVLSGQEGAGQESALPTPQRQLVRANPPPAAEGGLSAIDQLIMGGQNGGRGEEGARP